MGVFVLMRVLYTVYFLLFLLIEIIETFKYLCVEYLFELGNTLDSDFVCT